MFCPIMTREHPHRSPGGGSDDLPTAGASSLAPLSLSEAAAEPPLSQQSSSDCPLASYYLPS